MRTNFYDIESLSNVFTLCNFIPDKDRIDVYILPNDDLVSDLEALAPDITDRIHQNNPNFTGDVKVYDLREPGPNCRLAKTFGLSNARTVNDPDEESLYTREFRPVCDTDPDFDENQHPYLLGYNSYNYDTTMLAMYFYNTFTVRREKDQQALDEAGIAVTTVYPLDINPPMPRQMRAINNELFTPRFKSNMPLRLTQEKDTDGSWTKSDYTSTPWRIRKSMLMSGRHIDVARLNEKQQHVSLKRLIGMMGGQILESSKLKQGADTIENIDQLLDLIAYNVSDCVNLKRYIFDDKVYQGAFQTKQGLLKQYPELIYEEIPGQYKPNISPKHVRRDRLRIDSSSAQLATNALCPYGHLSDIPAVSFDYPSERKAKELGIPRVNVLEEARKFFYNNFSQPDLRAQFDRIYNYYKNIEGRNFNDSSNYQDDYGCDGVPLENINQYAKEDTCMYYYNADGTPSTCFVNFSIGGIHGAEYNKALYDADCQAFALEEYLMNQTKAAYSEPTDLKAAKTVEITMPDGSVQEFPATKFLKSGSTKKNASYKDIEKKRPLLFKPTDSGTTKINPKYVFTSADLTNHEDFKSYYPNLLRMMSAFYNQGLGYDRYAEIFDNKEKFGKLMKSKDREQAQRELYSVQREGTKLILNSASGAADASFESSIRMNNVIISMRIIGQLFSWRIGQAQTIQGAKIPSTNTDGLYSVMEATRNAKILEKESADIGVAIEPEPTYLISKDSNNRIELNEKTGKVEAANGGTLACRGGPSPTKSLAHPAIIDWALCEYLIVASFGSKKYPNVSLSAPFDPELGMSILHSAGKQFPNKAKYLQMFQNVIASSTGSVSYVFGQAPGKPGIPVILQHYNRVFIMKDGTPDTLHLFAAVSKKITPITRKKRERDGLRPQLHDELALQVLSLNQVNRSDIPDDSEAAVKKVTNIEDTWFMLVENRELKYLSDAQVDFIIDNLDYTKYLKLLEDGFENNWRNHLPSDPADPDPSEEDDESTDNAPAATDDSDACTASEPDTEHSETENRSEQTQKPQSQHDTDTSVPAPMNTVSQNCPPQLNSAQDQPDVVPEIPATNKTANKTAVIVDWPLCEDPFGVPFYPEPGNGSRQSNTTPAEATDLVQQLKKLAAEHPEHDADIRRVIAIVSDT